MNDIRLGGTITFPDGRTLDIIPHSQRVALAVWSNGAFVEVLFYEERQAGEDDSDRIHLLITSEGKKPRGWLMNVQDATAIIRGLSIAIDRAIDAGVPMKPSGDSE